jgi:hypothetical protein
VPALGATQSVFVGLPVSPSRKKTIAPDEPAALELLAK